MAYRRTCRVLEGRRVAGTFPLRGECRPRGWTGGSAAARLDRAIKTRSGSFLFGIRARPPGRARGRGVDGFKVEEDEQFGAGRHRAGEPKVEQAPLRLQDPRLNAAGNQQGLTD